MYRLVSLVIIAALSISVAACTPEPKLTKYYASAEYLPSSEWQATPEAKLSLFTVSKPGRDATTYLSLHDRAQAEYVKALASVIENSDPDKLRAAFAEPFKSADSAAPINKSRISMSRRLVFSIEKVDFRPADRIHKTHVSVKLPKGVRFTKWTRFANEYKDIDLGKLTLTQGNTFSTSGSLLFPKVAELGDINISAEVKRQLVEELSQERKFLKLGGHLTSATATLFQQGTSSIDLAGTFLTDVSLEFESSYYDIAYSIVLGNLFDNNSNPNKPQTVTVGTKKIYYPDQTCPIIATVEFEYIVRQVISGDETTIEGDDEVRYLKIKTQPLQDAIIIPEENLELFLWNVVNQNDLPVKWLNPLSGMRETLFFDSFKESSQFVTWLRVASPAPSMIGHIPLVWNPADAGSLLVKPVEYNKCDWSSL